MDVLAMISDGYVSSIVAGQVVVLPPTPVAADEAEILQLLAVPSSTQDTEAKGIHQSDFILRTAILAGIAHLRLNTNLLDYVFASLRFDPTTKAEHRERQIQVAKEWFINTKIPVLLYPRKDQIAFPCITLALRDSQEVDREGTTADTHYVPEEDIAAPITFQTPFAPSSWNWVTGTLGVPKALQPLETTKTMFVVDNNGTPFPITGKTDGTTILIAPKSKGNFSQISIQSPPNGSAITLESASFRETYTVGCHVQSEPSYLTYMHSIIVFLMLRYREQLLEARGFERSTMSSADFLPDAQYLEGQENVFSRYISTTGYVRQYWPKFVFPKLQGVDVQAVVVGGGKVPYTTGKAADQSWVGDGDTIS